MEQHSAVFFETSGLLWTSDRSGHRLNRYLRRLLGLAEENLSLDDETIRLLIHEEDRSSPLIGHGDDLEPFSEDEIRMVGRGIDTITFRVVTIRNPFETSDSTIRILRNITTELEQSRSLDLARFALEKGIDPIVWSDERGRIVFANMRFCQMVRLPKRAVLGTAISDLIQFADLLHWEDRLTALREDGARMSLAEVIPSDGSIIPVEVAENYLVQNRVARVTHALRDLRERKDLESRVEESERLTSSVLELMPLPVAVVSRADGTILESNNAAAGLLGLSCGEVIGRRVADFVAVGEQHSDFLTRLDERGRADRYEIQVRTTSIGIRWMLVSARLITRAGEEVVLVTFVEVSAHKHLEEELRRLATVDVLTGCVNRRSFAERGTEELARSRREESPLSVILLDLDHFKRVNDTWGHDAGDQVLSRFAEACRGVLRSHDTFGRFGGEEFGVLLPLTDLQGATLVAERIRKRIAALDVEYEKQRISITVSIGVAPIIPGDTKIADAIRRADEELYRAKESGRNMVCGWKG